MLGKLPDLLEVDIYDFEELIKKFVKKMGFQVQSSDRSPDGDLHITAKTTNPMGGELISLIRAGAYEKKVKADVIEDLYNDMVNQDAVRAAYITTSDFTADAIEYASDKPLSLINKYELIESLDREGIEIDPEMFKLLEAHGLTEKRFREDKYYFESSRSLSEMSEYFNSRRKKKFLGVFGEKEEVSTITQRFAPVAVFGIVSTSKASAEAKSLAESELEDNIFVNLNNADLYYIKRSRKLSSKRIFEKSDVLATILTLPDGARDHLFDLITYGDLPHKHLEDKSLSILEKKKVIEVYAPGSGGFGVGPIRSIIDILVYVVHELLDFLVLATQSISGADPSVGDRELAIREGKDGEEKNVRARVIMPHIHGGEYDLMLHMPIEKDVKTNFEDDPINHSSKKVSNLLSVILDSDVKPKGLVFMPYVTGTFKDKSGQKILRKETLISPKFISKKKEKKSEATPRKAKEFGIPYKIIR